MRHSIRLRLLLAALVSVGVGLSATGYAVTRLFSDYVFNRYLGEMETVIDTIANGLTFETNQWSINPQPTDSRFAIPAGGRYWQVDVGEGEPLHSESLFDTVIEAKSLSPLAKGLSITPGPAGTNIEVLSRDLTIDTPDGEKTVTVLAAYEAIERQQAIGDFRSGITTMLLLTGGLLMGAALLQVWVGTQPLSGLRSAVARVRNGTDNRLAAATVTEVRPLVDEINALLEAQEGAVERARARAADLAHGVKTPLTIISQTAETLREKSKGAVILDEVETIRQRTDRQLQQARLGVGQFAATGLKDICEKLVRVISMMPNTDKISWVIDVEDNAKVNADSADVAEALGNVIDNARKWAHSRITINAKTSGLHVIVTIADDGPGIAPEEYDAALARGLKAATEKSEHGLGLTISNDIVTAYGGKLQLGKASLGGLQVRFVWPVDPPMRKRAEAGPS